MMNMATFKDRDVFEFCEKLFEKLKKQDNGYFPHRHDKQVFDKAAEHFSISVDEVDRIYDSYTKLAAKAEMMKINRLPKAKRKAAMMRKLQDIVLHNKDLPFYKIEGEPSEPIIPATDIIEEEFKDSIAEIAQSGWTIPLTIDIERLDELRACSSNHTDIDAFFSTFYSDDELDDLYDTIYNSIDNLGQKKRFEECYIIFNPSSSNAFSESVNVLNVTFPRYLFISLYRTTSRLERQYRIGILYLPLISDSV